MPGNQLAERIRRCRSDYENLWAKVIERSAQSRRARGIPVPHQRELATTLDVQQSAVSRVLHGDRLPRSLDLLVKLAAHYEARSEETRVLLAWASAISAYDAHEHAVAEHFLDMFRPLYPEGGLADIMIKREDVAYNILRDLNVPPNRAFDAAKRLSDCRSWDEAAGKLMETLGSEQADVGVAKITSLLRTYRHIAVIDFGAPSIKKSVFLRHPEQKGSVKSGVWQAISHVVMTRIEVAPNELIGDVKHKGYEFVFLESGDGIFRLQGVGEVALAQGMRQFIAYRPMGRHSFVAGSKGAALYVISYCRPEEGDHDPAADILRAAYPSHPDHQSSEKPFGS